MGTNNKQRAWLALGLTGLLLVASGCSAATVDAVDTAAPSASVEAGTATPAASPSTAAPVFRNSSKGDLTTKLAPGPVIKTNKGEYLQTTLDPTDKVFTYLPDLVPEDVLAHWSVDEITAAQRFIANYIVTEIMDTPLNGAAETPDEWFARNEGKILPKWTGDARASLGSVNENGATTSFVMEQPWMKDKGIEYVYERDTPRIIAMEMNPEEYSVNPDNDLGIRFKITQVMRTEKGGFETQIDTDGTFALAVKRADGGDFVISGWDSNFSYSHHGRTM